MDNQLEQLSKAVKIAETSAMVLLKSEHPNHKAYTRTSASGTVSNVAQKGEPKHNLQAYYKGDHEALKDDTDYYGSHEKLAFAMGWNHENHKFKGYQTDEEPTSKQLGSLKRHYDAGKKHAQERTSRGHDADSGMHDAFDRHMGRQ